MFSDSISRGGYAGGFDYAKECQRFLAVEHMWRRNSVVANASVLNLDAECFLRDLGLADADSGGASGTYVDCFH